MFSFSDIVFDFAVVFLVAILVQNLYAGYLCEDVQSLSPQTKNPRYPVITLPQTNSRPHTLPIADAYFKNILKSLLSIVVVNNSLYII